MAVDIVGSPARLLIGLSLEKICRGGGGLRKNLLVATVLQKARLAFVEESKRSVLHQNSLKECTADTSSYTNEGLMETDAYCEKSDVNKRLQSDCVDSVQSVEDSESVQETREGKRHRQEECSRLRESKRKRYSSWSCSSPDAQTTIPVHSQISIAV